MHERAARPWYREPWPWLLMAGPFAVVVAGFVTLWLAIRSNDGLVTADYYRKGMAINQTLARTGRATALGIEAGIRVTADSLTIRLKAASPDFVPPEQLRVTVAHPTRAGLDQSEVLMRQNDHYRGKFRLPAAGHWLVLIEDGARTWRLLGNLVLPAAGETVLGGQDVAGTGRGAE